MIHQAGPLIVRSAFLAAIAFSFVAPVNAEAYAASFRADLNTRPLYVKAGFSLADVLALPAPDDSSWQVFPPSADGHRTVQLIDLRLPGGAVRKALPFRPSRPMEFTYLIPVSLDASQKASLSLPGLRFATLGDNWEIYVNGNRVAAKWNVAPSGRILVHRSYRNIHFPFDPGLLREGDNFIAVRMAGDPTFPSLGFYNAKPYHLASWETIREEASESLSLVLIGLYLFVGVYHLFIFAIRRKDLHYLFYSLFSVDLAFYLFNRTSAVHSLIADSEIVFKAELASLFVLVPLMGAFLKTLGGNRVGRVTAVYASWCALLTAILIAAPVNFGYPLLRAWQYTALAMALFYFGYEIIYRFFSSGRRRWMREGKGSLTASYLRDLVRTPAGNLLVGGALLFATAVFDILDALFLHLDLVTTRYGFFLFTMGTALILANRFGFLQSQLSGLNSNLEDRTVSLTETASKLAASERKYRSLFDGSSDPVVLLDGELRFREGNPAAVTFFGLDRGTKAPRTLADALYRETRAGSGPENLLALALHELAARDEPFEASFHFRTFLGEAKLYRVRMEYVGSGGDREILLRAKAEDYGSLAASFVAGRERFDIESNLAAAEEVCRRACANLTRFSGEADAEFLKMCLREIVVNAIEHGNLGVTFDEKAKAQREGTYFELLERRSLSEPYRNRKASMEYSISSERATFRVTDEGAGFNHRAYTRRPSELAGSGPERGRGLSLTKAAFDRVIFNEKGNEVTLVKYFGNGKKG